MSVRPQVVRALSIAPAGVGHAAVEPDCSPNLNPFSSAVDVADAAEVVGVDEVAAMPAEPTAELSFSK